MKPNKVEKKVHKGSENLIPNSERSPEELRRMRSNGGKRSVEVRRQQKTFKEIIKGFLNSPLTSEDKKFVKKIGGDIETIANIRGLMIFSVLKKTIAKGDLQGYIALKKLAGENVIEQKIIEEYPPNPDALFKLDKPETVFSHMWRSIVRLDPRQRIKHMNALVTWIENVKKYLADKGEEENIVVYIDEITSLPALPDVAGPPGEGYYCLYQFTDEDIES